MRNIKKVFVFFIGIVTLFSFYPTFAATIVSDNFNSYPIGNLTGNSGGSGWSAAWTNVYWDSFNVVDSDCQNGNCIEASGSGTKNNYRIFTSAVTKGSSSFYVKRGSGGQHMFRFFNSILNEPTFRIIFNSDNTIWLESNNIATQLLDTWQLIEVQFGNYTGSGCSIYQARARVDGGSWSSCINYLNNASVDSINFEFSNGGVRKLWLDEFNLIEEALPIIPTGHKATISTSLATSTLAMVSSQLTDTGTLKVIALAGGFILLFYVLDSFIHLLYKKENG